VVWQGFNGQWTHQGLWRYAYDFLIQDDQGLTYGDAGLQLTDYYAFQKPVLSPIRGWVVQVVHDLPDCEIGNVDQDHNWGNYVVLYNERGFYVEISHFAQNSIVVKPGDRIEPGALLGRCGNSGNSPQPHIHIQVQLTPVLGAATVPFNFANLMVNGEFWGEATPEVNAVLEPATPERTLAQAFSLALDSQLHFSITQKGQAIGQLVVIVRMAADSSFYLDSGKAKLFYSLDENRFMFHRLDGEDPWLALLFLAIPRLPLARQVGQQWFDYLPISMVVTGLRLLLYQFCSSFYPQLASARYVGQWQSESTLIGTISIPKVACNIRTFAFFNHDNQLVRVSVGDLSLVRQS
jgi:hypothetical protein